MRKGNPLTNSPKTDPIREEFPQSTASLRTPLFHPQMPTCLHGVCSLYGFPSKVRWRRPADFHTKVGVDRSLEARHSCGPNRRTFPYAQDLSLHQFAVAPSSHLWRAVIEDHDAVVASARHARHRRELLLCRRVAADLRVEERKRPREDVVGRGKVEPVFHA